MRAVSKKRDRLNRVRRGAERALYDAMPWCARCCRVGVNLSGHERLGRAQGGDPANPDCLLCDLCQVWCEDRPELAALSGWKISRKHPHDPALNDGEAFDLNGDRVIFAQAAS